MQARILSVVLLVASTPCGAQLVAKPDGEWRGLGGVSFSAVRGNAESQSLGLNLDAVRQRTHDKLALYGQALRSDAKAGGTTSKTADYARAGGKYDRNIDDYRYLFGTAGVERDTVARIQSRWLLGAGAGIKVVAEPDNTFDVFGGLNFRADRYSGGVSVDGEVVSHYEVAELQAGVESSHKLSESASVRQRFVVYPNLDIVGEFRSVLDASLVVSLTDRFKLTLSVLHRFDSLAAAPVQKSDLTLLAGVSVAFGPK